MRTGRPTALAVRPFIAELVRWQAGGIRRCVAVTLLPSVLLTACASYAPNPLPGGIDLAARPEALSISPSDVPLPRLGSKMLDLRRPLDMDELATLAVLTSPDLKAARGRLGVARAQAFAAGILPNPVVSGSYAFLTGGPGTTDAYAAAIAQDILPLLTLSVRRAAAERDTDAVRLDLLWQEWQVVSQARTLFVTRAGLEAQRAVLVSSRTLFAGRYAQSNAAMMRGDEILPVVAADLVTLTGIETQQNDVDQLILKNKHDINTLLGLDPDANLRLARLGAPSALDVGRLKPRLADLAARRPDILALKLGYAAEEERVRQTILEQFPKLTVGPGFGSDTTAVQSVPLGVSLGLPLFDHNQGNIAIEAATRDRLRLEYQARIDTAYSAAARLVTEIALTEDQLHVAALRAASLQRALDEAEPAFKSGNLDGRTYADLASSLVTSKLTAARLRQSIAEQRVQLQTFVGSELPSAAAPPAKVL